MKKGPLYEEEPLRCEALWKKLATGSILNKG